MDCKEQAVSGHVTNHRYKAWSLARSPSAAAHAGASVSTLFNVCMQHTAASLKSQAKGQKHVINQQNASSFLSNDGTNTPEQCAQKGFCSVLN